MRNYKMPRKYATMRKFKGKCESCGKNIAESDAYQRVDENNTAITWHAKYECLECAKETNKRSK